MTAAGSADARGGRDWALWIVAAASLAAVWALLRPYVGIVHDARIYVGRALADLAPRTLGLDYAFVHDGQSRFSLFPLAFERLVAAVGPGPAAEIASGVGLALWVAAAAWLLSRVLKGAALWSALVCLAALPAGYGGHGVLSWAEALATPRVFAEAASMAALGMVLDRRRALAAALFALALALHPLVALPAIAVAIGLLGAAERRWWLLFPLGLLALLAAALAGLPVASRLLQAPDPAWLAVLQLRAPYLFPARWPLASWALATCQATTLLLAWREAAPPLRRLVAAVAAVAVAGLAVAALVPSLLVLQMQPWRAGWLASLLAAGLFAVCAAGLWRRGAGTRAAAAFLAAAWIGQSSLPMAAFACGLALVLALSPRAQALPSWALRLAWPYLAVVAAGMGGVEVWRLLRAGAGLPLDAWLSAPALAATLAVRAGLVALAVRLTVKPPAGLVRTHARAVAAGAVAAALAAGLAWDVRPAFARWSEAGAARPPLAGALAGGEVLWLGDVGSSWLLTGAPEWWSLRQGAGGLFDRQLAVEWRRRFDILAGARMVRGDIGFVSAGSLNGEPPVAASSLRAVCATRAGPAWIVAPVERVRPDALAEARSVWRPPAREIVPAATGGGMTAVSGYALFSCAQAGGPPGLRPAVAAR